MAKKYLEEIERQGLFSTVHYSSLALLHFHVFMSFSPCCPTEKERAESKDVDQSVIEGRLKLDLLEQSGKLHKRVADNYTGYDEDEIVILKCKDHSLPVTCLVISADNKYIYSASKDGVIVKCK